MRIEDRRILCAAWLLAMGWFSGLGCGGSDRLQTVAVSGTVRLDGRPISSGVVVFTPEMGRAATGPVQSDGSYTLGTYKPGDGAVIGRHRVAVIAREELPARAGGGPPMPVQGGKWLIPPFYGDSALSRLSFEVKSDGPNRYDIDLSSTAKPARP
jgi:hypothetical protein